MRNRRFLLPCFLLMVCAAAAWSYDRVVNYTSTLTVNDFAGDGEVIWVASSGGLYRYRRAGGAGTLFNDPSQFPDPAIASLCFDANRTLWMGSVAGFLYKRPTKGRQTVVKAYSSAGWGITDIVSYGRYLIIGADKGCSVFDTVRCTVEGNATAFGAAFTNPQVNAVAVFRDTLLLGLEQGVAKLYIGGDALRTANFYDQSIWSADTVNRFPVKSFIVRTGGYEALGEPGTLFLGSRITARATGGDQDSSELFSDSVKFAAVTSRVTTLADAGGVCCIGTKYSWFYLWDGSDTVNVAIDGPTFTLAQKVHVDRAGVLWVSCPQIKPGLHALQNGRWERYNADRYPAMGDVIRVSNDGKGIVEDSRGRMWFGTNGYNVKMYDRQSDSLWAEYCIGCIYIAQGLFYRTNDQWGVCFSWAKSDAMAIDSSGFMWIGVYNNFAGSLICYDPRYDPPEPPFDTSLPTAVKHYRYFFPPADSAHSLNPGCLCVDAANNILMAEGFAGSGKMYLLRYQDGGNPLEQGFSSVTLVSSSSGAVYDAAAAPDTLFYVASTSGLFTVDPAAGTMVEGLWTRAWVPSGKTCIDSSIKGVRTVRMEGDRVVWIGTTDSGLIRFDLSTQTRTIVNESNGLLSNRIWDIFVDGKNGCLWIASERGVSRYALGYSVGSLNTGSVLAYPNPFSKRRHVEVVFEKLPPSSRVLVYTVSGSLVASLSAEENSTYGSACVWKPSSAIAPGIYLYSVLSKAKNSRGKIIVTP